MKKFLTKTWKTKEELDMEMLKFWKYSSTKAKLHWLQDAWNFAKASEKANAKKLEKISKLNNGYN